MKLPVICKSKLRQWPGSGFWLCCVMVMVMGRRSPPSPVVQPPSRVAQKNTVRIGHSDTVSVLAFPDCPESILSFLAYNDLVSDGSVIGDPLSFGSLCACYPRCPGPLGFLLFGVVFLILRGYESGGKYDCGDRRVSF